MAGMTAAAQQAGAPQVKVNVLNVCTPAAAEQQEISDALAKVPKQPLFGDDFEISRGRSTLSENPNFLQAGAAAQMSDETSTAAYVRIRREFSVQAMFSNVQYSFSNDGKNMTEVLVLRVRDPKDLMQVSVEDSATAVTTPEEMLKSNTPVSRIKLERFGKSSVVLARCQGSEGGPPPDQKAYEPLFASASRILANYRALLSAQTTVTAELAKIKGGKTSTKPSAASKKAAPPPK
jgi:hypothetical protein